MKYEYVFINIALDRTHTILSKMSIVQEMIFFKDVYIFSVDSPFSFGPSDLSVTSGVNGVAAIDLDEESEEENTRRCYRVNGKDFKGSFITRNQLKGCVISIY